MYKYLQIVAFQSETVVKRIDVTGKSESQIDKIDRGMNTNLNHDDYYTVEIESIKELPLI